MLSNFQRTALLILDGWGHGADPSVSAIAQASTPFVDSLYKKYPHSELITFGEEVGLPAGQMGNSEVGHLNIGAGRVVYQELARINKAIVDGDLAKHKELVDLLLQAKQANKAVHLMGLVSDGGVHSHIQHLIALCNICKKLELKEVYIHAFTDGRDTDFNGGVAYIQTLLNAIEDSPVQLASIIGRYYAMDRDKRWERIQLAYDLLVHGKGTAITNPISAINQAYKDGLSDEFLPALVCCDDTGNPLTTIKEGDTLLCFNFRTDRCRQISQALTQKDFPEHGMHKLALNYCTMTRYDESFQNIKVLFEKDNLVNTLGEVLAKAGKTQLRIAETEKYPHVTFFFSGGREDSFEGEDRLIIPSPKIATYDLQPSMSAKGITESVLDKVAQNAPDFICLNYANTDMVGHTGVFSAAVEAAETVDTCLSKLVPTLLEKDYGILIIADHGNSDFMINQDGSPHTAHTTNMVPCIFVANETDNTQLKDGKLGDIAPTILQMMQIDCPEEMTGNTLLA